MCHAGVSIGGSLHHTIAVWQQVISIVPKPFQVSCGRRPRLVICRRNTEPIYVIFWNSFRDRHVQMRLCRRNGMTMFDLTSITNCPHKRDASIIRCVSQPRATIWYMVMGRAIPAGQLTLLCTSAELALGNWQSIYYPRRRLCETSPKPTTRNVPTKSAGSALALLTSSVQRNAPHATVVLAHVSSAADALFPCHVDPMSTCFDILVLLSTQKLLISIERYRRKARRHHTFTPMLPPSKLWQPRPVTGLILHAVGSSGEG